MKRIYITADEHAKLMRLATGEPIATSFGGGRVWLSEGCTWPIPFLAQWRGVAFTDGAGI